METVFITVHNLTLDAHIKFCSASVEEILGYAPHEVKGKSCWEYFHPDEIPFARAIHGKSINLDKAAVLSYCRIRHRDGSWIGCECVFTVVHDVLVASTSIYKRGPKARRRALDGASVRRIFSSSPKDPRYHMLSYLSSKFQDDPTPHAREPRAALFVNRFTRSSTIMYATTSVSTILGISAEQLTGKSLYYCIAEDCLHDAVKCLESAKANDSIAYLRFRFRDPLQPDARARSVSVIDLEDSDEDEDEDGGVALGDDSSSSVAMRDSVTPQPGGAPLTEAHSSEAVPHFNGHTEYSDTSRPQTILDQHGITIPTERTNNLQPDPYGSRSSSGNSTDLEGNTTDSIFDRPELHRAASSATPQDQEDERPPIEIEVEAVVSCTSDGLVVILRRARPPAPPSLNAEDSAPHQTNGLFASPWAPQPIMPHNFEQTRSMPHVSFPTAPSPTEADFMAAIREISVFAWSLTGINGSLAEKAHGYPTGEALPPGGLAVWDAHAKVPEGDNERYNGFNGSAHRPRYEVGDPRNEQTSSEDEVVWKRAPEMTKWRKPKRRAYQDAFEDGSGADGGSEGGSRKKATRSRSKYVSSGDSSSV